MNSHMSCVTGFGLLQSYVKYLYIECLEGT